jgi:hypothetical protein
MRVVAAIVVIVVGMIAGCREQTGDDYVRLTGKIFVFNYRIAEASYLVTLAKLKPTPEGARVIGQFDNPAGGRKVLIDKKIWVNNDRIVLESEALRCVVKDRPYQFTIDILDQDGAKLQTISGSIISTLDQSILPDRPLVVGPAYTPNPDLEGAKLGNFLGSNVEPCP